MVAGREVTPKEAAGVERLKEYWAHGKGSAKIQWGNSGDFNRCVAQLGKYMKNPDMVKGYCAELHVRATGARPGHAPGESHSRPGKN